MASIVQGLVSGLDDFFAVRANPGTPTGKRQAHGSNKDEQMASTDAVTKEQADWFKGAIGGALTHLGRAVDERFVAVEARVSTVEKFNKAAEMEINGLKGELKTVTEELNAIKENKDEMKSFKETESKLNLLKADVQAVKVTQGK